MRAPDSSRQGNVSRRRFDEMNREKPEGGSTMASAPTTARENRVIARSCAAPGHAAMDHN